MKEVILAENAGFCFGVKRAVEGVDKIVNWIKNDVLLEGLK